MAVPLQHAATRTGVCCVAFSLGAFALASAAAAGPSHAPGEILVRFHTEGRHALVSWSIGASGRRSMQHDGDVYQDRGLSDTVVGAMDELRPEFREAVWLCDIEGMSYADAAQQISCPVGTIMSRLHRGRRALRRRLGSRQQVEAAA